MSKLHTQYPLRLRVSYLPALILLTVLLAAGSCRSKKQVEGNTAVTPPDNCGLANKNARTLSAEMKQKEFSFTSLSAKLDCEAHMDSTEQKFDVNLRIKRDSMIWLNITDPVLGIRVARAIITPDSVKFVNFFSSPNKCFQGDFAYISKMLNTDLDYDIIQAILVGNSVAFYEDDEKLHASVDQAKCNYILSTVRKRRLRKAMEGQREPKEPLQNITIDPKSMKIMEVLFRDFENNRNFNALYSEFEPVDSVAFPHKAVFTISDAAKKASIDVKYGKVTTNKQLTFPFSIPDDCEPIQFRQKD
jgi:hypothetical protein